MIQLSSRAAVPVATHMGPVQNKEIPDDLRTFDCFHPRLMRHEWGRTRCTTAVDLFRVLLRLPVVERNPLRDPPLLADIQDVIRE